MKNLIKEHLFIIGLYPVIISNLFSDMSEMFPTLKFNYKYWECGMGFRGILIVKNNQIIKNTREILEDKMEEFDIKELQDFTGTEHYYQASILYNLKLTDGMEFLRNRLNCYWLIDIVGSVQHLPKIKENDRFILWKIEVKKDKSFKVSAYSDFSEDNEFNKTHLLYSQKGNYTDFPLKDFEFYQVGDVLLLTREY